MTVKKETGMKLSCLSTDTKPTASDYAVGTILVETDTGRMYINDGSVWQDLKLYGLTSGSIPFAGTDGEITEDNANLFWDNTNKKLGIGTAVPGDKLSVGAYETPAFTYNQDKTIGIYGAGAAYFRGRDTTNDIEFIMGTSTLGGAFAGSVTSHDFWLRTNNKNKVAIKATTGNVGIGTDSPNSKLQINGSLAVKRTATAEDYTTAGETIVGVTDTTATRIITLATADCVVGRLITIKDESGGAGTNNITIATEGSETIDGSSTATISTNYGCIRLYSDGSNWFII